jgi:hypothetical protein
MNIILCVCVALPGDAGPVPGHGRQRDHQLPVLQVSRHRAARASQARAQARKFQASHCHLPPPSVLSCYLLTSFTIFCHLLRPPSLNSCHLPSSSSTFRPHATLCHFYYLSSSSCTTCCPLSPLFVIFSLFHIPPTSIVCCHLLLSPRHFPSSSTIFSHPLLPRSVLFCHFSSSLL